MAFKMKSSPYGEKRSGEMDMKPRMSKNFEKSGMKNADGSPVKPGAPGMFGRIAKGVLTGGMSELFRKKKGGQAKTDALAAAAPGAVAPGAVAPGAAVPVDEQAGPVAPPAGVVPADPTLGAAPVQMKGSPAKHKSVPKHKNPHDRRPEPGPGPGPRPPRPRPPRLKGSPAKDMKSWTAEEMGGKNPAFVAKDIHNDKHRNKQVDANHKPIKKDKKADKKGGLKEQMRKDHKSKALGK